MPYRTASQVISGLEGRKVAYLPVLGWETRAAARGFWTNTGPEGIICHHSASTPWSSAAANISVVVNGNSVAPGPIGQHLMLRDGVNALIALGKGNHAGAGEIPGIIPKDQGNSRLLGIEAINAGAQFLRIAWNQWKYGGNTYTISEASVRLMDVRIQQGEVVQLRNGWWAEVWTEQMLVGYAATVAALIDVYGLDPTHVWSHQKYAPTRKVDPAGPWFDEPTRWLTAPEWMERFYSLVNLILNPPPGPGPGPQPPPEEDLFNMAAIAALYPPSPELFANGHTKTFLLKADGGIRHAQGSDVDFATANQVKSYPIVSAEHYAALEADSHK